MRPKISLFRNNNDECNEKWYVASNCCVTIVNILQTNSKVCDMLSKEVVQKKYYRRSARSTKTRKFYTAGNEADGRWVEEATTATTSIQEGGYGYRELQRKSILQKEADEDSDATVEMNDDDKQTKYTTSEDVNEDSDATVAMEDEDSDATVVMEDDAELETNSPGDETKMSSNVLGDDFGICNTVRTEDEIYV